MGWIEAPVREGNDWYAVVVNSAGERSREPLHSATEAMERLGKPSRRRVVLDLPSGYVDNTETYLNHFGINELENRHDVMTFFCDGKRILFPAFLLAHSIFTPFLKLLPHLVRPAGLDRLCHPTGHVDGSAPPIKPAPAQMTTVLRRRGIDWALAWFYYFPTANRCWVSLAHALRSERLSLQLPKAHARFKLSGHLAGDTFFVTRAKLIQLTIDEEPPAPLTSFPNTIVLWTCIRRKHQHGTPTRVDLELAALRGTGDLSDEEWNALQPVLDGKYIPRKHETRATLNGIVRKITSGTSWKKTVYETGNSAHASVIHANLVRSGLWGQITETLKRTATSRSSSAHSKLSN